MFKKAKRTIKYITCSDCQTEWIDSCGLCKKVAFQSKKIKIEVPKKIRFICIPPKVYINKKRSDKKFWLKKHPRRVVDLILKGHDAACVCCYAIENLTFDHIIPLVEGGKNSLKNGQILCYDCNQLKGGKLVSVEELREEIKVPV